MSETEEDEASNEALDSSGEITLNIPKFPIEEVKPDKVEVRSGTLVRSYVQDVKQCEVEEASRSGPGWSPLVPDVKANLVDEASTSGPGCSYQTYCNLDVKLSDDEDYFGDDDDISLQEALLASANPTGYTGTNDVHVHEANIDHDRDALKEMLLAAQSKLDMITRQVIRVRRRHLWEDTLRAFNKSDFSLDHCFEIHFIGEEAADEGGPKREFFRLLMSNLAEHSGILEGAEGSKKTFTMNPVLLASNTYFQAGRMVAASIQQGGPGIRCLSSAVFWYMAEQPKMSVPSLDEIGDPEVQDKVRKIHDSATEQEFAEVLVKEQDLLFACGISKTKWSFSEKVKLVSVLCDYSVIHKSKAAIDQFKEGVMSIPSIKANLEMAPHLFKELFTRDAQSLTSDEFRALYQICFSPEGANNREGEELTTMWWEEFVDNLGKDGFAVSVDEVLTFITGADTVPPAGFSDYIKIKFFSQVQFEKRLPYCSTCSLEFYIPRDVQSYQEMEEMLLQALQDCHGFGKI